YRVVFLRALNLSGNPISRTGCSQGSVSERRVVWNYPKSDQIRLKRGLKRASTTVVDRGFRREPGASAPGKSANFECLQARAFAPFLRQEASTAVVLVLQL